MSLIDRQRLARRLDEGLVDLHVGLIDHVEILVQHHHHRQAADAGLGIDELVELRAILIEHRFCARQLDRGRDDVGAHDLGVLAHIGFRHDQRILDQRMGLPREQPVEPAVERDARDHRDQDRGNRGNQRKQGDDAHMQPRRRPATPARLQDAPDFPADERQQQKNREGIHQQQREHDLMGRQNRREIGKHHKGRKRRQQGE